MCGGTLLAARRCGHCIMEELFDNNEAMELALLRAEHQKHFQMAIGYIKEKVGQGTEYRNEVVRVVVSEHGAYYELYDLPEEFCGAVTTSLERRFLAPEEAIEILDRAVHAASRVTAETTRRFTVLALYTRKGIVDRRGCFVYDFAPPALGGPATPVEVGAFRPGVLPLFYKVRIDADYAVEVTGMAQGVLFCMANAGDRNLLVRLPYGQEPLLDLASVVPATTIQ